MDERRLKLKVGSPVIVRDSNCGYAQQLILDPRQEKVMSLIVKPDLLTRSGVIVPINQVAFATEHEARLRLDRQLVLSLPKYKEESPFLLEDQWYIVEKDRFIIRRSPGIEKFRAPSSNNPRWLKARYIQ